MEQDVFWSCPRTECAKNRIYTCVTAVPVRYKIKDPREPHAHEIAHEIAHGAQMVQQLGNAAGNATAASNIDPKTRYYYNMYHLK